MRSAIFGLTRRAVGVAALAAILATSACVAMPVKRTGASDAWKPPSPEKVMDEYDDVSNRARANRDLELIGEVESGPLLAVSRAALRIERMTDPDGSNETEAVTHENVKRFMPAFENYPLWFVDQSTVETDSGESETVYGVTLYPDAGSSWRRLLEVTVDEGVEPPDILTDDSGAAVPVSSELNARLARPADAIPRAYAGWINGGLEALHAGAFVESPGTESILEDFAAEQDEAAQSDSSVEREVIPTVTETLATNDNGALVLFGMEETVTTTLGDGITLSFQENNEVGAYTGKEEASSSVTATYVWQVAAYVPPTGRDNDLVTLLGFSRNIASAEVK